MNICRFWKKEYFMFCYLGIYWSYKRSCWMSSEENAFFFDDACVVVCGSHWRREFKDVYRFVVLSKCSSAGLMIFLIQL